MVVNAKLNKYRQGGWRLLIKAVCILGFVFIIEKILGLAANKDTLGLALEPFHNKYISFYRYYITDQGLASEFSNNPSATSRFVVYLLFGYLAYAVLSIIAASVTVLKKYSDKINFVLLSLLVIISFSLAFFIPHRRSVIDTGKKEIAVTTYSYLFIPATKHIPFNSISHFRYDPVSAYDGYNKEYLNYLVLSVVGKDSTTLTLGELQTGTAKGTYNHKPVIELSSAISSMADNVVAQLNAVIK